MSAPPEKGGPGGQAEAKALGKLPNHYSGRSGEQLVSTNGDWRAIPVSMVRNATATETSPVTLGSFVEGIRDGKWEIPVKGVRDRFEKARIKATDEGSPDPVQDAKDAVRALKEKKLPGICPSGTFLKRANDGIVEHSGYLCPDLDKLGERLDSIREKLKTDEHVQSVWLSPTGSGLKALMPIEASKESHLRSFRAVKKYFRDTYDVGIDKYCKDVSRLCFVSHDPDIFIRPEDAAVIEPLPPPEPKAEEVEEKVPPQGSVEYTDDDAGNAELFIDRFGYDLRYVHGLGNWIIFDGRWRQDDDKGILRQVKRFRKELLVAAASGISDRKAEDAAIERAQQMGKVRTIRDMLTLAESDARVALTLSDIDNDPWLVGAGNAVIDLRTGEARTHSRECYITKWLAVDYDPDATCPRWRAFIEEIFLDPEVARYVWKAIGYSLTGIVWEKVFFFLYGGGNNGKTIFSDTIFKFLGGYAKRVADSILRKDSHGNEPLLAKAEIFGRRFLCGSEIEEDAKLNEKLVKDITGGDVITGRFHYKGSFDFSPVGKLWLYGNHKPVIKGTDEGIWSRVRLIPFLQKFEGAAADRKLGGKLLAELPGILNWAIAGALLWQKEGLEPPKAITDAVEQYRVEEDDLGAFLREKTRQSRSGFVLHGTLFAAYEEWAKDHGVRYTHTSRKLSKLLRDRHWDEGTDGDNKLVWRSVELKGRT
jgi:P4 family phage/plasmid primase-like protien